MPKYIEANKLKRHYAWWRSQKELCEYADIFDEIVDAQTAQDVEKIVRCKDCSLNEDGKCRLLVERDPNTDHRIWSEFFCAYGERK